MKNLKLFENFGSNIDQQKAIDVLEDELSWNMAQVHVATEDEVKAYTNDLSSRYAKGMTTENGLVYWGMAGQSILKDIKAALDNANIKAKVYRGFETTRNSDDHDYIIILL